MSNPDKPREESTVVPTDIRQLEERYPNAIKLDSVQRIIHVNRTKLNVLVQPDMTYDLEQLHTNGALKGWKITEEAGSAPLGPIIIRS